MSFTAADSIRERVANALATRSLLGHPFYRDWTRGTLSRSRLQEYARQYFHFEAGFPRWLSAIHSRTADPKIRQLLLQNLWDEEHGDRNHRELWLEFAEAVGVPRHEVEASALRLETRALVDHFGRVATSGTLPEAMATLFAYEGQVPLVAAEKIRGLESHYGLAPDQFEFFTVHLQADVAHAEAEIRALVALDASGDEVVAAIHDACDRLHEFLDGCYAG